MRDKCFNITTFYERLGFFCPPPAHKQKRHQFQNIERVVLAQLREAELIQDLYDLLHITNYLCLPIVYCQQDVGYVSVKHLY